MTSETHRISQTNLINVRILFLEFALNSQSSTSPHPQADRHTEQSSNELVPLQELSPGDFFGHQSFLPELRRGWLVRTRGHARLYRIDKDVFLSIFEPSVLDRLKARPSPKP